MDQESHNYSKYEAIREIALDIASSIRDSMAEEEDIAKHIVELAGRLSTQDMSEFATRKDLKDTETSLTQKIKDTETSLTHKIDLMQKDIQAMPNNIMWSIVKYGTVFYAVVRVLDFLLQSYFKG